MKNILVVACVTALLAFGMTSTASAASPDEGQISSDTLASMGLGSMRQMTDQEGQQIRGTFARVGGFAGFLQAGFFPGGGFIARTGFGHALGVELTDPPPNLAAVGGHFNIGPAPLGIAFGIGGGVVFNF
jgi:hypothetical protein